MRCQIAHKGGRRVANTIENGTVRDTAEAIERGHLPTAEPRSRSRTCIPCFIDASPLEQSRRRQTRGIIDDP